MRWAAVAPIVAATIAMGGVAEAASRVAVVVPRDPDATTREATTRLEAELRGAGFEVVSVPAPPGGDARAAVEATSVEPRPIATIAIQPTAGGAVADVWVADHLSEKTLVRKIRVDDADPSSAVSTLAIRAVERLRASLLELREPARAPRRVPADVARWIEPPPAAAPALPESPRGPAPSVRSGPRRARQLRRLRRLVRPDDPRLPPRAARHRRPRHALHRRLAAGGDRPHRQRVAEPGDRHARPRAPVRPLQGHAPPVRLARGGCVQPPRCGFGVRFASDRGERVHVGLRGGCGRRARRGARRPRLPRRRASTRSSSRPSPRSAWPGSPPRARASRCSSDRWASRSRSERAFVEPRERARDHCWT